MRTRITSLLGTMVAFLCIVACSFAWLHAEGRGQTGTSAQKPAEKEAAGLAGPKAGLERVYYGISACTESGCHSAPKGPTERDVHLLCRGDEVDRWHNDRHQNAYTVLLTPQEKRALKEEFKGEDVDTYINGLDDENGTNRAGRMAIALGVSSVAKDQRCLACHSSNVPAELCHETFRLYQGVSCAQCHGSYLKWYTEHYNRLTRAAWRQKSREEKETEFGMIDLWNPEKRAKLCASCHIGDYESGKVVTHEMYAAGHPPLPGIEFAAFANSMPRHWQYLQEKSPEVKKALGVTDSAQYEQTKLVLVGGLVALATNSRLLADEAEAALKEGTTSGWPALAQFDCYACHHELERPSSRQQRATAGTLGRPQLQHWPTALARLGLYQLHSDDAALRKQLDVLHEVCAAQPFGQPAALAKAARELADWTDARCAKLNDTKIDDAAATRLLQYLVVLARDPDLDYDTARQIAWAFQTIYNERNLSARANQPPVAPRDFPSLELNLPLRGKPVAMDVAADLHRRNAFHPESFRADMQRLVPRIAASRASAGTP